MTVTIVALVLSISAFGAYLFFDAHLKSADEYPVITLKNDVLSLSVTSTEKDFLEKRPKHMMRRTVI